MITLKNITKTYGGAAQIQALKGINLTIEDGEIFGIIGKSGAGKSTLVRCINMLEKPTSGEVIIDDKDLCKMSESQLRAERKNIGMIFQHFNLMPSRTVTENIEMPLKLTTLTPAERKAKISSLLELVELSDKADAYPSQLSGGQKQRVAIAGVVAMRPDCLILDEATAMLDPRGREQVMQTIHYLNRNMGITVVSITHYMEEAAQADRVLVMSKGHVVMEGTPKEVFSQTEKVRALHLDVPQAAELRDELVKAGIPMPEGIIDTGACAQALYELLQ